MSRQQAADSDADRWREAARLRNQNPGWVIIWLAPIRQFRAYPLNQARRAATAATTAGLAEQISRAPR